MNCNICDIVTEEEICPMCGTNLLAKDEDLIYKNNVDYQKKLLKFIPGTLFLTNKRFFWIEGSQLGNYLDAMHGQGVVGSIVGTVAGKIASKNQNSIGVEIPISNLTNIRKSRQGVRSAIRVDDSKTGKSYKFLTSQQKKWLEELCKL